MSAVLRYHRLALAACAAVALSACGGNSSSSPAVATATPSPTPSPAASPTPVPVVSSGSVKFDSMQDALTVPANTAGHGAQIPFPLVIGGLGGTLTGYVGASPQPGVPTVPSSLSSQGGNVTVHTVLVYLTLQFSQEVAFLTNGTNCSSSGEDSFIPVTFTGIGIPANTPVYVAEYNTPNGGSTPAWRGVGPFTSQSATAGFTYDDCELNPWSGTAAYALVD